MQLRLLNILFQFIKVSITYYNRHKAISQTTTFSQFGYFGYRAKIAFQYGGYLGCIMQRPCIYILISEMKLMLRNIDVQLIKVSLTDESMLK